ncbi:Eukaryotic translation initiation factor 3 subunit A, partial [Trichinella murrelli]
LTFIVNTKYCNLPCGSKIIVKNSFSVTGSQMSRWQKPENALRRANDLLCIGKKEHALDSLQDFINFPKNRVWSKCFEEIMNKLLYLCVEMRRPHVAKDALFQYRRMCQQLNVKSLEDVITNYLNYGEKKAEKAKAESQGLAEEVEEDFDLGESPERLLLSTVTAEGTLDRTDRSVLSPWLRFLWESYRHSLELLRNNTQLETLYHRVARLAFQFCLKYQRRAEFRKLADILRYHIQQVHKQSQNQFAVKLSNPETITLHQETRLVQLDVAINLESWQEAIRSMDDIQQLIAFSRRSPKPSNLAIYLEKIALLFWKSNNVMFHAAALLKLYQLYKETHKSWFEKDSVEPKQLATRVLLAILSIPEAESPSILSRYLDFDDANNERPRQLAKLLNMSGPPTRKILIKEMMRLGVNLFALPEVYELYEKLRNDQNPMVLARDLQPYLHMLEECGNPDYQQYLDRLYSIICIKVLKQLSQVYKTVTLEKLSSLIPYLTGDKLERELAYASKRNVVRLRINYMSSMVEFGVEDSFNLAQDEDAFVDNVLLNVPVLQRTSSDHIRLYLQEIFDSVNKSILDINANYNEELRRNILRMHELQRYHAKDDHLQISERRKRIELYKEYNEKKRSIQVEHAREEERRLLEKRRQAEKARLEQENAERLQEMKRREKDEMRKRIIRDRLDRMKDSKFRAFLAEMPEEEIENLDNETLLQKQICHMEQEKREHMARLKVAEKKWDHFVRALHMEEIPLREQEYSEFCKMSAIWWEKNEKDRIFKAVEEQKKFLETRNRLSRMFDDAAIFMEAVRARHHAAYLENMKVWDEKMKRVKELRLSQRKEIRKQCRRTDYMREKADRERCKLEQERKRREEEAKIQDRVNARNSLRNAGFALREDRERRPHHRDDEPEPELPWSRAKRFVSDIHHQSGSGFMSRRVSMLNQVGGNTGNFVRIERYQREIPRSEFVYRESSVFGLDRPRVRFGDVNMEQEFHFRKGIRLAEPHGMRRNDPDLMFRKGVRLEHNRNIDTDDYYHNPSGNMMTDGRFSTSGTGMIRSTAFRGQHMDRMQMFDRSSFGRRLENADGRNITNRPGEFNKEESYRISVQHIPWNRTFKNRSTDRNEPTSNIITVRSRYEGAFEETVRPGVGEFRKDGGGRRRNQVEDEDDAADGWCDSYRR